MLNDYAELWSDRQAIQDALLDIYCSYLDFSINAVEAFAQNIFKVIFKLTFRFSPIELKLKDAAKKINSTTRSFMDRRDYVRDFMIDDTWKRFNTAEVVSGQKEGLKLSRIFSVPKARNGKFCGRKELLEQLERDLLPAQSSPQKSCTLHGAPGMGKTQIALEFAYRCCETFPELHIFWVPAEDEAVLAQALSKIARLVGGNQAGKDVPDQASLVEAAITWLCESESPAFQIT